MTLSVSDFQGNPPVVFHPSFSYQRAEIDEAKAIVDFMQTFYEVAFCDWQSPELTHHILLESSTIAFTAKKNGGIVGVIMGGILGTRGTINHLAVDPIYRRCGIGTELTEMFFQKIKKHGIRRAFLFVSEENLTANSFWTQRGFQQIENEITLECDF